MHDRARVDTKRFEPRMIQITIMTTKRSRGLLLLALGLNTLPALAADFAFSGFGTVGYAVSDQHYKYQRFINDKGTVARDSILAGQMDVSITPEWSATVQAKFAPALDNDHQWEPTISWAFISWRPSNDWLIRAGKLRVPLYMHAENMDVGTTYDYARLPIEMYSMTPTSDFIGASANKTWDVGAGELALDGYWGATRTPWRQYYRDGVPSVVPQGATFDNIDITIKGLALAYRESGNLFRVGLHQVDAKIANGQAWIDRPTLVSPLPGISYYAFQPGIGLAERDTMKMIIANLGFDVDLGQDIRLASEYAVRKVQDMDRGLNSSAGYVSLRKQIGQWTPYVYYAQLRSDKKMRDLYQSINNQSVPAFFPNSALLNASQRAIADAMFVYDQNSWAIGTSYALSPTQKIKAEWLRTHVGVTSSLVDAPTGSNGGNQNINVFSLSYSMTF